MDDRWRQNRPSFIAASTAPTHGHLSSVDVCTVWSRPERLGGPATDGHGPSRKNTFVCSEKRDSGGWEKSRVRKEGERRGHASGTHQCSPHTGQFIRIIKPCLALKVKLTINLTWIQKERDEGIVRQTTKTSFLLCPRLLYYLSWAIQNSSLICFKVRRSHISSPPPPPPPSHDSLRFRRSTKIS